MHANRLMTEVIMFYRLSGFNTKIQRLLRMRDVAVFPNLDPLSKWNHTREYKIEMCRTVRRSIDF